MNTLLFTPFYVLFAVLAWRRLPWAVLFVIAALPSYLIRFSIGPIPTTLLEGMILIIIAVWVLQKIQTTKFSILSASWRTPFSIPVTLFLVAATISLFVAPDLRAAAGIWKAYFLEPILFFIVLNDLLRNRVTRSTLHVTHLIAALAASLIVPGLFAIYQKFTGAFIPNPFWAAEATRRVTSFYGFPNAIGLYFAPIIMLLIGSAIHLLSIRHLERSERSHTSQLEEISPLASRLGRNDTGGSRLLHATYYLLLTFLALAAIIFAQSKGALAGIFAGLIFFAIFAKGYRKIFVSIIVAAIISTALAPQFRTLTGARTVSGGGSLEVRTQQWAETWAMLKERPILGAGLSGYQTRIAPFHQKKYIEIFMYPHNIVLNFWSETGLLGLLAFAWLVVLFFRATIPPLKLRGGRGSYEPITIAVIASMVALLAHGLVDVPYFKNDLALLFWIVYALAIAQPLNTET